MLVIKFPFKINDLDHFFGNAHYFLKSGNPPLYSLSIKYIFIYIYKGTPTPPLEWWVSGGYRGSGAFLQIELPLSKK